MIFSKLVTSVALALPALAAPAAEVSVSVSTVFVTTTVCGCADVATQATTASVAAEVSESAVVAATTASVAAEVSAASASVVAEVSSAVVAATTASVAAEVSSALVAATTASVAAEVSSAVVAATTASVAAEVSSAVVSASAVVATEAASAGVAGEASASAVVATEAASASVAGEASASAVVATEAASASASAEVSESATLATQATSTGVVVSGPTATVTDGSFWIGTIDRNGVVPFADNSSYTIFRNVKDYGATGDGSTDDTDAINSAITDGDRCGKGCGSSTTTPALVYFPPGTYMVSAPIVMYYYTQLVGDANDLPVLKAMSTFSGMAVLDSDPYEDDGANWYVNQNNFFRQVRNFEIDLTGMDYTSGAGIHWQVAQATSLQNIVFNMNTEGGSANGQKGIFMDNGSGGFMSDLTFNGGGYGMWVGNQQFTTRNMTFSNCQTAIYINWDWVWTIKDVTIDSCQVGLDISTGGSTDQTVGSALFLDSTISNTPIGVNSSYSTTQSGTNGTLIIDNVDMSNNVDTAIQDAMTASAILAGNQVVSNFVQGNTVGTSDSTIKAIQAAQTKVSKAESLLTSSGSVYSRSKPQYESYPSSSFVSAKAFGLKGDGSTDDTALMQEFLNNVTTSQIAYFDHGAYIVTDTIKVPKNIKITGEVWSMIMAKGDNFGDMANPRPVFQVGQPGETGAVEMSDLLFQTAGPVPGAIMIEWNLQASSQGAAGMWDVHNRIGGSAGTSLLSEQCAKNNGTTHDANADCEGTFLMMHITDSASDVYLENTWFWVADHDLEPSADSAQIDIYNGRGVLIESQGPVWLYGTASEHSVMYNYQLVNASAVYMAQIQTETAYFQGNPAAPAPFTVNSTWNDPSFDSSSSSTSARTWGLRVVDSTDVYLYGGGLYSFFDNYNQQCLETEDCQDNMVSIESSDVHLFGLSTKASVNMLTVDGVSMATDADNRNTYCATLSYFTSTA